jgi:hypothetical protein
VTPGELAIEAAGWAGSALILLAYLLLSAEKTTGQSLSYQAMNIVGAAGIAVNAWWHSAIPPAVLDIIWFIIGVVATWRILKKRGSSTSAT